MKHVPDLNRISEAVAESFGVRQVFGEPIERDGALVIPAARIWSGGGGGGGGGTELAGAHAASGEEGSDPAPGAADAGPAAAGPHDPAAKGPAEGSGGGLGFGRRGSPAGAFVVDDEGVRWVPAVDVNRIALVGQVAFVLAAVVVGWVVVRRRK